MTNEDNNPYAPSSHVVEVPPRAPNNGYYHPVEAAVVFSIVAFLVFLVLPTTSQVRLHDKGWPWLDIIRISPEKCGMLFYCLTAICQVSLCAIVIAIIHHGLFRLGRNQRFRMLAGLTMVVVASIAGLMIPPLLYQRSIYRIDPKNGQWQRVTHEAQ